MTDDNERTLAARSDVYMNDNLTGIQIVAARAAPQRNAETLLGRLLFSYAQLESDLDLCLVWVEEGRDLDARTLKIEKCNFSGKLDLLKADAGRLASEQIAAIYCEWVAAAQAVRVRRNLLAHGRLCVDVRSNSIIVTTSRATSVKYEAVHFGIEDLQSLIADIKRLSRTLSELRETHPL